MKKYFKKKGVAVAQTWLGVGGIGVKGSKENSIMGSKNMPLKLARGIERN